VDLIGINWIELTGLKQIEPKWSYIKRLISPQDVSSFSLQSFTFEFSNFIKLGL
jgi:hypothetical protein